MNSRELTFREKSGSSYNDSRWEIFREVTKFVTQEPSHDKELNYWQKDRLCGIFRYFFFFYNYVNFSTRVGLIGIVRLRVSKICFYIT